MGREQLLLLGFWAVCGSPGALGETLGASWGDGAQDLKLSSSRPFFEDCLALVQAPPSPASTGQSPGGLEEDVQQLISALEPFSLKADAGIIRLSSSKTQNDAWEGSTWKGMTAVGKVAGDQFSMHLQGERGNNDGSAKGMYVGAYKGAFDNSSYVGGFKGHPGAWKITHAVPTADGGLEKSEVSTEHVNMEELLAGVEEPPAAPLASRAKILLPAQQRAAGASRAAEAAAGQMQLAKLPRRRRLDVRRCADDFPAFTEYLERSFGTRLVNHSHLTEPPRGSSVVFELAIGQSGKVELKLKKVGSGTPYKRHALLKILQGVVDRYGFQLRRDLKALGGSVLLHWRHMNGDCPEQRREHGGLPLHGWSSDQTHADVAMPDFTFEDYVNIQSSTSNAWRDVSARLHEVKQEKRGFMWRGSMSNAVRQKVVNLIHAGPPEHLRPLLDQVAPDGFDVDILKDDSSNFVSLQDQCKWPFTFHMPGKHYSANLKYKLACNQTVFMVMDGKRIEEFWYPALKDKQNVFFIKKDLSNLWQVVEDALSGEPLGSKAAAVAEAGQAVADNYLSQRGLDCYSMLYLSNYYLPLVKSIAG